MYKFDLHIVLKNSFNLINDIISINDSKTSFSNNERLLFSFDVKSLYDSLNLDQCIDILDQINSEFLNWNPWMCYILK